MYLKMLIHTHTHTHTHIYIYKPFKCQKTFCYTGLMYGPKNNGNKIGLTHEMFVPERIHN